MTYDNIDVKTYQKILGVKGIDNLIPIIFNIPESELDVMDMDDYSVYLQKMGQLAKQQHNFKYDKFVKGKFEFYYKDIFKLTFGEYLDMIHYIKNNQISYLYAIFWRLKVDHKPLSKPILENYSDFDIDFRSKFFETCPSKYFFQIKNDIEKLDDLIKKKYKIIFEDDNQEEIELKDNMDARVKAQYMHEQKIKESFSKNAWEYTTYSLANGDVTKYEQIFNTSFILCLNVLKLQREMELKNKKTY